MTQEIHRNNICGAVELLSEHGFEGIAHGIELILEACMKMERQRFLGVGPSRRSLRRNGRSNGFKRKRVKTRVDARPLAVPQTPEINVLSSTLEKGTRSEKALRLALAEMYVQGVSTAKVSKVTEELCGCEITSSEVSRAAAQLDEELEKWRTRPLGEMKYLILDARYEKLRDAGCVVDCAVLIAIGVDPEGHRSVIGASVSRSDGEVHWREFFQSLLARGLHGVELISSDAYAGMGEARKACFPHVPWQRCQFNLQKHALDLAPTDALNQQVSDDLKGVFDAADANVSTEQLRRVVRKYKECAPNLSVWIEENVPDGLTVFRLPKSHRRRLRTSNKLQQLNRHTRVTTLFHNEMLLLRLVSARLMEQSEEWETGRRYLTF